MPTHVQFGSVQLDSVDEAAATTAEPSSIEAFQWPYKAPAMTLTASNCWCGIVFGHTVVVVLADGGWLKARQ